MSHHRKPPLPESMKRSQPGHCGWCDKPIINPDGKPSRRSWHPDCVVAFKLIHWPYETRNAVFDRDRGICARCGVDTVRQKRIADETMMLQRWLGQQEHHKLFGRGPFHGGPGADLKPLFWLTNQLDEYRRAMGWPPSGTTYWQHDHIRPLIEARGDISFWALENIQTLCTACHITKGKEDNARRRAQREQATQPVLL